MLVTSMPANEGTSDLKRYSFVWEADRIRSRSSRSASGAPQGMSRNPFGSLIMDIAYAMGIGSHPARSRMSKRRRPWYLFMSEQHRWAQAEFLKTLPWGQGERNPSMFLENPQGRIL